MELNSTREGELLISRPAGRLDGTTSRDFEDELRDAIGEESCSVVLDFSGLQYISSAGLRAVLLITKAVTAKNRKLVLCSLPIQIREVFEISGFDKIIPIYESNDEAVQALTG